MKPLNAEFAHRLTLARDEAGYESWNAVTRALKARGLSVSTSTYYWGRGDYLPRTEALRALAVLFEVSIDWLLAVPPPLPQALRHAPTTRQRASRRTDGRTDGANDG